MKFFDFHHHKHHSSGIYNLNNLEKAPDFYFSAGIHPKDIDGNFEHYFQKIQEISLLENCLAIGECGLDSLINVNENLQELAFRKHILWANEIRKPVIIHCVRRFSEILKFKEMAEVPLIIHGFNKKQEIAESLLTKGFYLSFGKAVLQNVSLQQTVKEFPIEKMFLETDDTDFELEELYRKVAELKGISLENLQEAILENLETIGISLNKKF